MTSSRALRLSLVLALLLAISACDDGETTELSTTSSLISSATTVDAEASTTTTPTDASAAPTTLVGESVSGYEVVARVSDPAGETLFIVIPPGAYTDVDMENFTVGLVDDGTVTYGAEIFDDAAAVDAFRKPEAERTEAETQLIQEHHFASVQNAGVVVFQGPFAESPDVIIGS
ncbi:MAG TPA: hypothetical protein VFV13_15685 [Acidimicrobiia bacterium]|nr:hypothetical protein [Acidimicrobiia bacterium]